MRELRIAGRRIADDEPCYVIAEIGGNHGGDVGLALALIDIAYGAGVDAVKFQKKDLAHLYSPALMAQPYENENSYGATYGEHKRALEFTPHQLGRCQQHATELGLTCFATAFDEASVDVLMDLEMPAIKIHSGGLTDRPLLQYAARAGVPVILSTGGGTIDDVDQALRWLGDAEVALLHCTATYPLRPDQANLRVIDTYRQRYADVVIGFSSHSPGLALSLIAYALGARILEHHITHSRAAKGTDHAFSLEPKGLGTLVEDLDQVQRAMGDGIKVWYPQEKSPISKMRRVETDDGWKITGALA